MSRARHGEERSCNALHCRLGRQRLIRAAITLVAAVSSILSARGLRSFSATQAPDQRQTGRERRSTLSVESAPGSHLASAVLNFLARESAATRIRQATHARSQARTISLFHGLDASERDEHWRGGECQALLRNSTLFLAICKAASGRTSVSGRLVLRVQAQHFCLRPSSKKSRRKS